MLPVLIDLLVGAAIVWGYTNRPGPWWLFAAAFLVAELAADVREWRAARR